MVKWNAHASYLGDPLTSFFFKDFIYWQREGRGGTKKGKETSVCETNINVWLPLAHPQLGTWPAAWTCALTGN